MSFNIDDDIYILQALMKGYHLNEDEIKKAKQMLFLLNLEIERRI